jgi:hypothetical protein
MKKNRHRLAAEDMQSMEIFTLENRTQITVQLQWARWFLSQR